MPCRNTPRYADFTRAKKRPRKESTSGPGGPSRRSGRIRNLGLGHRSPGLENELEEEENSVSKDASEYSASGVVIGMCALMH